MRVKRPFLSCLSYRCVRPKIAKHLLAAAIVAISIAVQNFVVLVLASLRGLLVVRFKKFSSVFDYNLLFFH